MSQNEKNFAQRMRDMRIKLKLTQEQLGEKLGFKGNTAVYRFESGTSSPSIEVLCRLAKILNIDIHLLITGSPSPTIVQLVTTLRPQIEDYLKGLEGERAALKGELLGLDLRRALSGEKNEDVATKFQSRIAEIDARYESLSTMVIEALGCKTEKVKADSPIIKSSKK